jgi:hypothetical protein
MGDGLVSHPVAVRDDPGDFLLAVLAGGVAGEPAVDDEIRLADGLPGVEEDLAGTHLTHPEP